MTDEQKKKPGVLFWATVLVVCPLAYPLSFGPACWLISRTRSGGDALATLYGPLLGRIGRDGSYDSFRRYDTVPETCVLHHYPSGIIPLYATLFAAEGWRWRRSLESVDPLDPRSVPLTDGRWSWTDAPN
jgi:hypothetical protein